MKHFDNTDYIIFIWWWSDAVIVVILWASFIILISYIQTKTFQKCILFSSSCEEVWKRFCWSNCRYTWGAHPTHL